MNISEAKLKMNELGRKGKAFLFLIDFEMEKIKLHPLDTLDEDVLFNYRGHRNYTTFQKEDIPKLSVKPYPKPEYSKAFQYVMDEINYGNTFLINLTTKNEIFSESTLRELFFYSRADYKLFYKNQFIFFSPEPFVRISDSVITSYPMKGTIDANTPNAKEKLLTDQKESAEHNTIVDLIRNDISQVAHNVSVPRFKYIDHIKSPQGELLQMSSEIKGSLPKDHNQFLGDLIFKLLPAGSISGAPKTKTIEIIKRAENEKRGYYTGVSGIFNGKDLDTCVMIRFIENEKNKMYYRSGGGITFMSQLESEYEETLQKIYVPTH